ncbi:MAG: carbohydrate kinase family protein [Sphaerochaetaceae bacterium]|nr:carbohydrate kinase family protein [Sphaerochaetaceae bacterium]
MSILCIGQIVFDILVQPVDAGIFTRDTTRVKSIDFANGGDALNVAVVAHRLGNDVHFCGKVGDDDMGRFLIEKVAAYGLSTEGIQVTDTAPTSTAVALIQEAGARNFLFNGGATLSFNYDDISMQAVEEADIVFVGGTYTMPLFDGEGAKKLFREAKSMGKLTAMDVTYDSSGKWMKTIEPCLEYLDYFVPSEDQAREITGEEEPGRMAQVLRDKKVHHVIIKMGSKGVYVKNDTIDQIFPAPEVGAIVDTTGAGDSFVAGFLSGINRKLSLKESLNLGQLVAGKCIGGLGATAGFENIEQTSLYKQESGGF